jgi:LPXTG-site transpeptidase (sortase) family protein
MDLLNNSRLSIPRRTFATVLLLIGTLMLSIFPVSAHDVTAENGVLVIPSIVVQAQIVHVPMAYPTWDVSWLGDRVGDLEGTGGWPGQPGNFVLAGHSSFADRPGIFANLMAIQVGQEIELYMGDGLHRYVVTRTALVDHNDISVVLPSAETKLTLITCDEPSYNGVTYMRRFVVVAVPVG